jgi:hypothetical protein
MKGVDQIVAMRMRRLDPTNLFFTDCKPQGACVVQYDSTDSPATADLRFVVGLLVTVDGTSKPVVKAWADAIEKAGASRVIWNLFEDRGNGEGRKPVIVAMGDSQHLMDWSES